MALICALCIDHSHGRCEGEFKRLKRLGEFPRPNVGTVRRLGACRLEVGNLYIM